MTLPLPDAKTLRARLLETTELWCLKSDDSNCQSIRYWRDELTEKLELEQLVIDQQKCTNAEIGRTRKNNGNIAPLIARSKTLTEERTQLESEIATMLETLLVFGQQTIPVAKASALNDECPGQFASRELSNNRVSGRCQVHEEHDDEAWDSYIATHPNATHYHQAAWRQLVQSNFGHDCHYLTCRRDDVITGVLPLVHMDTRLFGHTLLSMPFLVYGGTLPSDAQSDEALSEKANSMARLLGCSHVELRETCERTGWHARKDKVAMVRRLPDSVDEFNVSLGARLRSQVKRAALESWSIEFGGAECVADFYAVFSEKMRDLGTPVYHQGYFNDMATRFSDSMQIVVVRRAGVSVAGACLINYRDTIEIPWAASKRSCNRAGVNMWMYHAILEYAVQHGYRFFDFGRSSIDSPTFRFKRQWGAEPLPLHWHLRATESDSIPAPAQSGVKMQSAIAVWKRLPLSVANRLGPPVARNLPW